MNERYKLNANRRVSLRKKNFSICIFCDTNKQVTVFKGKPVCGKCLQNIPNLFLPLIK
jgi:hypothetical protein